MSVDDRLLADLCERAGVATRWIDAFGKPQDVSPDDLGAVLSALGLDCASDGQARDRIASLQQEAGRIPPLLTGDAGGTLAIALPAGAWRLRAEEDDAVRDIRIADAGQPSTIELPERPGYYVLESDRQSIRVAVAPARCYAVGDALSASGRSVQRAWGLAQQLYALRRPGDGGVGDFRALASFVEEAAAHGAASVSISPVHAQFSADPDRFSPYAPSSRIMLNVLHVAPDGPGGEDAARLESLELVDWPAVGRDRLARLRRDFEAAGTADPGFAAWRAGEGDKLEAHALFEALHRHLWREQQGAWHWKDWPDGYGTPDGPAARAFGQANQAEVDFHAWLQYRADRDLQAAQKAAIDAGMPIGLISDLAVGTDSGGSHCWSRQDESLLGLTVGAPPDLLQRDGQNWGITAFSGQGLRRNGFRGFIEMLTGAMRHAGGVRIDHAMGLNRLWVVPEGYSAARGAYLRMPETDLLRLLRLESLRHRAVVLGEDLGTVPDGFQERLEASCIDGMRVLWFEQDETGFKPPSGWTRQASAMTSTHDLPTVAGWWKGVDIGHRRTLGGSEAEEREALRERDADRQRLWQAMQTSGAADGDRPPVWDVYPVVDAAVRHVGLSGCELAVVPIEDALGLEEQPNIPGTTTEHPNWRRRLERPVGTVLDDPRVALRLAAIDRIRAG